MRVLHLIRIDSIGGAERVVLNGIPALRACGVDASLGILDACEEGQNPVWEALDGLDILWNRFPDRGRFRWGQIRELTTWIQAHRIQVLHVHGYRAAMYGLAAARWAEIPIAVTRHGVLSRNARERLVERIEVEFANRMGAVISVAPHLTEPIRRNGIVVPNGIPIPDASVVCVPEEYPRRLLFVGRLSVEKNPSLLLDVFGKLCGDVDGLCLDIVGDGVLRQELERRVEREGWGERVVLHGFADPTPFYAAADFLCMTSDREGLPLVSLEAMASGIPVLSTRVGALPSLLDVAPVCGATVAVGDLEGYVRQVRAWCLTPGLVRELGANGRKRVSMRFGVEHWAQRHSQIYRYLHRWGSIQGMESWCEDFSGDEPELP